MMQTFQAVLGIGVIVAVAALLSRRRSDIPWRAVAIAIAGRPTGSVVPSR